MTVYTDLFNEAIDDLIVTLSTITDLRVTTDPQKINPPCVFLTPQVLTAGHRR
jgi:hypothetical protein